MQEESCFVIMPFGGHFDNYYSTIYSPAVKNTGLIPIRADDLFRTSAIVNDIWELTKSSKLVLADLTTQNPNVFYELGLAHAIAKPAILISNKIDDVPFDLRGLRTILYDKEIPNWGEKLQNNIEKAITETLESPINSVLPNFIKSEYVSQKEIKITIDDFLKLRSEIDELKSTFQHRISAHSILSEGESRIVEQLKSGIDPKEIQNKYGFGDSEFGKIIDKLLKYYKVDNVGQLKTK